MADIFVGLTFEALCGELVKAIKEVRTKSKEFKPLLQQLESTVDRITPIFKEIESLNQAVHRPKTETEVFGEQLDEAKNLVLKCAGVRWWNKSSYAKKLIEYDRSLTRFFQIDVTAQILHSVRRVEKDLAGEKKKEEGEKEKTDRRVKTKGKTPPATVHRIEPIYWGTAPGSTSTPPPPPPPPPPPLMKLAMGTGDAEHPLDFLRNSPQFQALRPLLQKNPRLLELTLQGLQKKHPNIFELIEDRKDAFEELINEPVDGSN